MNSQLVKRSNQNLAIILVSIAVAVIGAFVLIVKYVPDALKSEPPAVLPVKTDSGMPRFDLESWRIWPSSEFREAFGYNSDVFNAEFTGRWINVDYGHISVVVFNPAIPFETLLNLTITEARRQEDGSVYYKGWTVMSGVDGDPLTVDIAQVKIIATGDGPKLNEATFGPMKRK